MNAPPAGLFTGPCNWGESPGGGIRCCGCVGGTCCWFICCCRTGASGMGEVRGEVSDPRPPATDIRLGDGCCGRGPGDITGG